MYFQGVLGKYIYRFIFKSPIKEVSFINIRYPRIRELREDNDMTQKEVSKYLNMSQTGYSKYETGENDIPTRVLIELAKLYSTTVDYLLNLTDNPKRFYEL